MAAFDQTAGPDLEVYAGQEWSTWQRATESESDGAARLESDGVRHNKEVARLKRQDFGLFGYCPAKDNFYVVICEHCHLPFKPQAFRYHIEKHHKKKSLTNVLAHRQANATLPRSSPLFQQASSVEQSSVVKSSASNENSSNSSASSTSSVNKKLDKASLSQGMKQGLHKVINPPGTSPSPSSIASPIRSSLTPSNHKKDAAYRKHPLSVSQSGSSSSGSSKSSAGSKSTFPVEGTTKVDKRTMQFDPPSKHSKIHNRNFVLQTKPHKVKSENIKKINEGSHLHHSNKHEHRSMHNSSKGSKKGQLHTQSNISMRSKHAHEDSIQQNHTHNGPVVVLEKSPILEKSRIPTHVLIEHAEHGKEHVSRLEQNMKSTTLHSIHQYNHNVQRETVKYSGQEEVAKAVSVERLHGAKSTRLTSNSKKNLPIKAREYDPNKHCGVLVSAGMPCTRSLSCKTHARNFKRKVPGRSKPYDELVIDFANEKQRSKERSGMQTSSTYPQSDGSGTPRSTNSRVHLPSTITPPLCVQAKSEQTTSMTSQSKAVSSSTDKSTSQSTSKTKSSIHLFPRTKVSRHIDCWPPDWIDSFDGSVGAGQSVLSKHPSPIMLQHYGARVVGNRHTVYSKKSDHQWKSVLSIFKNDGSKNKRRPSFVSLTGAFQTNLSFSPIPSVSRSVLTSLKTAKDASERQKQQRFNETESDTVALEKRAAESYASQYFANRSVHEKHVRCQKHQSKSLSIDDNSFSKRTALLGHTRLHRNDRHTIDTLPGPPLPKSQRCSLPLEHGVVAEEQGAAPTSLHGKFVQLSTTSTNLATSSNTQNFNLNSYLVQEQSAISALQSESGPNVSLVPVSKRSSTFLQNSSSKVKRLMKGRKNSLKYQTSTSQPDIVEGNHSTMAASATNQDPSKHEVSLVNGLSSSALPHVWPQSVTLSGTIGALMQTNSGISHELSASRKPVDLKQQKLSSGGTFDKQTSRNANNSNNNGKERRGDSNALPLTTVEVNGQLTDADDLRTLLYCENDRSPSRGICQLAAETATRTTLAGVRADPEEQSISSLSAYPVVAHQGSDLSEEWTEDILSLLNSDRGKTKGATSSHDITFSLREDGIILSNEQANFAK